MLTNFFDIFTIKVYTTERSN